METKCLCCDKPLNADGNHPAETYAGTYNGLCYSCTLKGKFIQRTYEDGARIINFPPHCPSWRRDRETYIGYEGCEKCKGLGRIMIFRPDSRGGDYPQQCKLCSDQYYNNPIRSELRYSFDKEWKEFEEAWRNTPYTQENVDNWMVAQDAIQRKHAEENKKVEIKLGAKEVRIPL